VLGRTKTPGVLAESPTTVTAQAPVPVLAIRAEPRVVVLSRTAPNSMAPGVMVTVQPLGARASPKRGIKTTGVSRSSLLISTPPISTPTAIGSKSTAIKKLPPGGTVAGRDAGLTLKVPLEPASSWALLIAKGASPWLVQVRLRVRFWPTPAIPKSKVDGEQRMSPPPPVPATAIDWTRRTGSGWTTWISRVPVCRPLLLGQ
jgi:hypothetical protein